jgi:hypothetical protein
MASTSQLLQGLAHSIAAVPFRIPAKRVNARGIESDYRDVATPATPSPGVFKDGPGGEPEGLDGEVRDFGDGDGIVGGNVEDGERGHSFLRSAQRSLDDIGDVNIGLALLAVAEDAETFGFGGEAAHKVESHAVGLAGADDVPETENAGVEPKHGAIAGNERFARELAGPIGGDGHHGSVIFGQRTIAGVAIDAAARGIEEMAHARAAHRFDDVIGEQRAAVEVDFRALGGQRNVGIGGQMDDPVVALHRCGERAHVAGVGAHDVEPGIGEVSFVMPLTPGGEVVEDGDAARLF